MSVIRRFGTTLPAARQALGVAALSVFSLAACGREVADTGDPFAREAREAIPAIEKSIGLTFKEAPRIEGRTRDEVREFLERQFHEQVSPLELEGTAAAYKRLGLLPDTLDLRTFLLDLLTEQVAGYYDPSTKVLYVVAGGTADMTSITIQHELIHALQDQYTPLDSVRTLKGDNDRQVAIQALMEGQATYEQLAVMSGGDFTLRIPGGWDRVRESIRSNTATMPRFASAPVLIQETLLFPYLAGAQFARDFKVARPGQVPYTPLPSSTEQILHPEKYLADSPDIPTRVTFGPPRGATLVHEDNLGEFEVRLLLNEHLADAATAARAAAGWDGDRYQLVSTPSGEGLAWLTVWDSQVEAAEFRNTMQRAIERRYRIRAPGSGEATDRRWTASGRALRLIAEEIGGRPVVVYEDMPAAITTRVLDTRRVTLEER